MTLESIIREIVRDELSRATGSAETPESLRLRAGMSLERLGAAAGLAPGTVGRIERGACKRLQPLTLAKIAKALGVDAGRYGQAATAVRGTR